MVASEMKGLEIKVLVIFHGIILECVYLKYSILLHEFWCIDQLFWTLKEVGCVVIT